MTPLLLRPPKTPGLVKKMSERTLHDWCATRHKIQINCFNLTDNSKNAYTNGVLLATLKISLQKVQFLLFWMQI